MRTRGVVERPDTARGAVSGLKTTLQVRVNHVMHELTHIMCFIMTLLLCTHTLITKVLLCDVTILHGCHSVAMRV